VTGTVWSGTLARESVARVMPLEKSVRFRGLESHGSPIPAATTGMRAAVALAGVEVGEVRRGQVLVADESWASSTVVLASVEILGSAHRALGPRTQLRFHLGTADIGARVVAAGGTLRPGSSAPARIVLEEPVVARAGDRFVLRAETPLVTVGGGIIDDPMPQARRARPWRQVALSAADRLERHLADAGVRGVAVASLPVRLGTEPAQALELAGADESLGARRIGDRLYSAQAVARARAALSSLVDEHHRVAPLDPGAPLQSVRARVGAPHELVDLIVREALGSGELQLEGGLIARRGWRPRLSDRQARLRSDLLAALQRAGREPPSASELQESHGEDVVPLLRLMEREREIVAVEADRWFARPALEELVGQLRSGMRPGAEHSPAELRDILGFSRKFLIPFLEYCDRHHITERRSSGRVLLGP
jgi:selenocysteine-specific elongation factor